MDSNGLRIFQQVAELRSISKAADKLGYVQSNISQRIKLLEEELGVELLRRNNRGVTLTRDGEMLLDYAHRILQLIEEARSSINPDKWPDRLVIGATQTVSALKIPRILSSFLAAHRQLNVKVRTDASDRLLEELRHGEMDGAFVTEPPAHGDIRVVYTMRESVSLISSSSRSNPTHSEPALLVNSHPGCIYRNTLIHTLKKESSVPLRIIELDSLEGIMQSVSDGLGISLVPSEMAKLPKYHRTYKVTELPKPIQIYFVIRDQRPRSRSLNQFIDFLSRDGLQDADGALQR